MSDILKGIVKGAVAGAAGVWVMDRIVWYMYRHEDPKAYLKEKKAQVDGKYAAHVAASKISGAFNKSLSGKELYAAGKGVHYMMGMLPGALYGAYVHNKGELSTWKGLLYGLGLFVVVDEIVVPLLGLTSGPRAYPWQAHARGLIGHLAMGAATDAGLKVLDETTV